MTKTPITIGMDEPFSRVWGLIRDHKIRHIPVVDSSKRLRGIITQRDLYRTLSPKKKVEEDGLFYLKEDLDKFILSEIMTEKVVTLSENQTIGFAFNLMVKKKFGCIPVVDKKQVLIGIVTQIDLLRAVSKYFI